MHQAAAATPYRREAAMALVQLRVLALVVAVLLALVPAKGVAVMVALVPAKGVMAVA